MRSPAWWIALVALGSPGCGADVATVEQLKDPAFCISCHPDHYQDWLSSMHAYSDRGPLFTAMLARGQRETGGALGDRCVRCHSPMALREGRTTDGQNLATVEDRYRGVTCYFCHSMVEPHGPGLADDGVMRGPIADPIASRGHRSTYSALHDRNTTESSAQCSDCHTDTFWEWKTSLYSDRGAAGQYLSCGRCHTTATEGQAAQVEGAPTRRVHDHKMAGVDVPLGAWPGKEDQLAAIHKDLDASVMAQLCVEPGAGDTRMSVLLDNLFSGHKFPTGVPRQRAMWVELTAYAGDKVVYTSGAVPDGEPALYTDGWVIRERYRDDMGHDLLMPWATGGTVTSNLLTPALTNDPKDPNYIHSVTRMYGVAGAVDRITMRVRLRPTDFDILGSLVASGDLDPAAAAAMPTLTIAGTVLEWKKEMGRACVPRP